MFPLIALALIAGLVAINDNNVDVTGRSDPSAPPPGTTGFEVSQGRSWIDDLSELDDDPPGNGLRSQTSNILQSAGRDPQKASADVRDLHDLGVSLRTMGKYKAAHRADLRAAAVAGYYHLPVPVVGM